MRYGHVHAYANSNLYAAFRDRFEPVLDSAFIEDVHGRTFSYRDLDRLTARMAGALRGLGVREGERVAALVEKSPESIALYLATARIGAIFVPMNVDFRPSEVEYVLKDCTPRVVVCALRHESDVARIGRMLEIPHVLTLGEQGDGSFAGLALAGDPDEALAAAAGDDVHALVYTSGTTGRPKGAMLTNGLVIWNALILSAMWEFSPADTLIHVNPYAYSLFGTTNVALVAGASMLLLPKFNARQILELLPRATVFLGVPTHYARLLQDEGLTREACRHMRLFVTGSAPMRPDVFEAFVQRTGHRPVDRYGLTENLIFTSTTPEGRRDPGCSGAPLPDVDVRLIDDDGHAVPDGAVGMLAVKGPYRFAGYWGDPEKTRRSYTDDGYLVTGDYARRHPDGQLTILGRGAELVISGGLNVFPKEIEDHVNKLPNIKETAVIGVPHPDFGEAVVAVVETWDGADADEAALIRTLKEQISGYKVPKRILSIAEMPRTALGKIQKTQLKATYANVFEQKPA